MWRAGITGLIAGGLVATGCRDAGSPSPAPAGAPGPPTPSPPRPALIDADQTARIVAGRPIELWFRIQVRGYRVGGEHVALRRTRAGEPGAFVVTVERWTRPVRLPAEEDDARDDDTSRREERYYAGTAPFPLVAMHVRSIGPAHAEAAWAVASRGGVLGASVRDAEPGWPRWSPATGETLARTLALFALPSTVPPGSGAELPGFDVRAGHDAPTTITVESVRDELVRGVEVPVVQATLTERDRRTAVRFAGGRAISFERDGVRLVDSDRAAALRETTSLAKDEESVFVGRPLGRLRDAPALTVLVDLPADLPLPSGPHQQVTGLAPGRYRVLLRPVPGPRVTRAERDAALAPAPGIDSDAAEIVALARRITAGAGDDRARVDRLVDWVHRNLAKDVSVDVTAASEVLARRAGACLQHTLLLVALARAAGIPARDVSGLVHAGDGRFGWHAWAQVAIDGRWVAVDPTWGERIADPGHLILGSRDGGPRADVAGAIAIAVPPP